MFELNRSTGMSIIAYIISIVSFIVAIIFFANGGKELLFGTIAFDYLLTTILMCICAALALLSLLLAVSLSKISKDISEKLTFIYEKQK